MITQKQLDSFAQYMQKGIITDEMMASLLAQAEAIETSQRVGIVLARCGKCSKTKAAFEVLVSQSIEAFAKEQAEADAKAEEAARIAAEKLHAANEAERAAALAAEAEKGEL